MQSDSEQPKPEIESDGKSCPGCRTVTYGGPCRNCDGMGNTQLTWFPK